MRYLWLVALVLAGCSSEPSAGPGAEVTGPDSGPEVVQGDVGGADLDAPEPEASPDAPEAADGDAGVLDLADAGDVGADREVGVEVADVPPEDVPVPDAAGDLGPELDIPATGACPAPTSASVVAIPFDFHVVEDKGRWITLAATSGDVTHGTLEGPTPDWGVRYKATKWGGTGAIQTWQLDSLPEGSLYEGTTPLSAGDTLGDPDDLYFVPAAGFTGQTSFGYCVTDSSGASAVAEVTLHVHPAQAYPMPLGVPDPGFGIAESPPPDPPQWPSAQSEGSFYVDSDAPGCTDEDNDYGYPDLPRCSWPPQGSTVTAGGKLVLAPSAAPYPLRDFAWDRIFLLGEPGNPAWIVGDEVGPAKPRVTRHPNQESQQLRVTGSHYRISGVDFDGAVLRHFQGTSDVVGDQVVVRYSRFRNNPSTAGGGTSVGLATGGSGVLAFQVNAHDNGVVCEDLCDERDIHAFVGVDQSGFWMLDILCSENAGDCLQLTNGNTSENVYLGRAAMHSMMENCVDIKDFDKVVVSESDCWDIRTVSYTSGSGGGAQSFYVNDEGEQQGYVHMLNNRSWDTNGTSFGAANIGGRVYVVGNRAFASPAGSGLSSAGGGGERHYYLNTVVGAAVGLDIYTAGGDPARWIAGNYVGQAAQLGARVVADADGIDAFDYNAYGPGVDAFAWGSNSTPTTGDFAAFQAALGFGPSSLLGASPGFVDAAQHDFRLTADSDLLDALTSDALATVAPGLTELASDLGIELTDFDGTPRAAPLDLGADELD